MPPDRLVIEDAPMDADSSLRSPRDVLQHVIRGLGWGEMSGERGHRLRARAWFALSRALYELGFGDVEYLSRGIPLDIAERAITLTVMDTNSDGL